jgi:hypothetical protein
MNEIFIVFGGEPLKLQSRVGNIWDKRRTQDHKNTKQRFYVLDSENT